MLQLQLFILQLFKLEKISTTMALLYDHVALLLWHYYMTTCFLLKFIFLERVITKSCNVISVNLEQN